MRATVLIYNPLPAALGHFENELVSVLLGTGHEIVSASAASAEVGGASLPDQVRAAGRDLLGRLRTSRTPGHIIVCWPVLGLAEPALWATASPRTRVTVIVHDPVPLRRQVGMGRLARNLGRAGTGHPRVSVAALSTPAVHALQDIGWPEPVLLPHPILLRPAQESADREIVLVCGQYKPARDLRLLEKLGAPLRSAGLRPVIRGRGWPDVTGWEVDEGFLTEERLDEAIAGSAAVLVPYAHFFQSGIAVRALELGIPVVGPSHPFLAELLGHDWPGLVGGDDPAAWATAVASVVERREIVRERLLGLRASCEREWTRYLD